MARQAHVDQARVAHKRQVSSCAQLHAEWHTALGSLHSPAAPSCTVAQTRITAPAWRSVAPGGGGAGRKVSVLRCYDFQG